MNAFEQIELIRDFIGESSAAHWSTLNLLQRLNMSQQKIAQKIAMTPGQWLTKSASVIEGAKIIAWHLRATESLVEERLKAWAERNRSFTAWIILWILWSPFRRALLYIVILFPGVFGMGMLGNMCVWRLLQYPVALSIFHELEIHRKRKAFAHYAQSDCR